MLILQHTLQLQGLINHMPIDLPSSSSALTAGPNCPASWLAWLISSSLRCTLWAIIFART